LVDLALSGFAFGLVMGWSALFVRPISHARRRRRTRRAGAWPAAIAVWATGLALVTLLALWLAIPGWALAAGIAAGVAGHAILRQAIAVPIGSRGAGR
jgi:hypothetical protein